MIQHNLQWTRLVVSVSFILLMTNVSLEASVYHFTLSADDAAILTAPMPLDVEGIDIPETHTAHLYRIDQTQKIPLAGQLESGRTRRLWYMLDRPVEPGQTIQLTLEVRRDTRQGTMPKVSVDDRTITLSYQESPVLRYHHAVHPVPEGVDPVFQRSAFIHPLYTPDGMVVTRIQPPDHYHHYGIWSPWTRTRVEGRAVDFWNLGKGEGFVRFAGLLATESGPVYAGFQVHQEHVMYVGDEKEEKTAINEVWDIRAACVELDGRTVWVVDYTSTLSNALDSAIELLAYRYGGGLGFRATDDWNKDTLVVLTSEGKTRNDADGTRARWADVRGAGRQGEGTAGVLFLSHFSNREHPEPMRVWPENAGPNGVMFFEFCPIRHNDWILEPNRQYLLRYRLLVYDGKIDPDIAETLWKNFSQPAVPVKIDSK